ncbi:MAG: hypothetical protein KAS72_14570 [Phycisphaerales bacterium]|nr:hypothetical protein [Phycisphaerales bacterium]
MPVSWLSGRCGRKVPAVTLAVQRRASSKQDEPHYVQRADINRDGLIDTQDLSTLLAAYGGPCEER